MPEPRSLEPTPGVRVEWDGEGAWRLAEPLPDSISRLRVLTAELADGDRLLAVAARPAEAREHGHEAVSAVLEPDPEPFEESLLSVEYAEEGEVRRVGLELYRPGEDYPVRAAGDTRASEAGVTHGLRRHSATLDFRASGRKGVARLDVLTRDP